jgi:GT2 family glycosyltransferase/peptidoglycan/xylan/chitin deacetylase (PgdA/CDA1 family)
MDVSIIIVNWNTKELLRDCLTSIFNQAGNVDYKVIVVDNGSIDGSPDMMKEAFPQVTLIENSENRGYAAACNQGIKIADGTYVLLLNSDTLICDSAVEKTVRYANEHPRVGIVGCQVWESQDKIMMTCFRFPSLTNVLLYASGLSKLFKYNHIFGRERMRWWRRDSERQVDVVTGVFMLVRREAIDQVGLMDEGYFFYSEEVDWCYRFAKAGWTRMFWPDARIIHVGGGAQSSRKVPEKAYVHLAKGKLRFFRKHRGFLCYLVARALLLVLFLLKYCLWTGASITTLKSGERAAHRVQRRKAWCALKFVAFGVEPGASAPKRGRFLFRAVADMATFTIALLYSFTFPFVRKQARRIIIFYHGVNETDVAGFTKQMAYLAKNCRVVRPSMIKDAHADGAGVLVAITFDDAFASVRENALPVLRKYDLPAGIFVATGHLGQKAGWAMACDCRDQGQVVMSEQQIAELSRGGFEVLSHTISHSALTQVDDERLEEELTESQRELQKMTGHAVSGISYPYGAHDARVREAARRAGYKFGFTVEPQMAHHAPDDMTIGRFKVSPTDNLITFRLKVNGGYEGITRLRRLKELWTRA